MQEFLMRPEEVAEVRLHVARSTVYELMRRGELRSVKIGKSRRVPSSAVDEYIARLQEEQSTGPTH
jgi:excisionase family DNA binding protein